MNNRVLLGSTFLAFIASTPVVAGPCTQRIAELEKSITATQEGAGPALGAATTTGSTASSAGQQSVPAVTPETKRANDAMQMLREAKQLDQQGKEAECMQMVTKVGPSAPAQTK